MTTEQFAWKIRRDVVEMAHVSGISHIGSAMSIADIIAVLYNETMTIFPDNPKNDKRDRFILSKGHAGMAVYAALAEMGFFPVAELIKQGSDGSRLSGHVSHKNVPGVELSTGSLGMGLSVGAGMAVAAKRDGKKHRIFVVLGDGECAEGAVWESVMFAGHNDLSNLIAIVDCNKLQANDRCENVLSWKNIAESWKSFGWHTIEVNGHDISALRSALRFRHGVKPVCVIAHTIKGKGVSYMEDEKLWHHLSPQGEDYINAVKELEDNRI
jgi:transketolase